MLPIPTPTTDVLNLADWLELKALLAADKNASHSDLRRALNQSGALDEDNEDPLPTSDETLASDTFAELRDRAIACGIGYPFSVDDHVIQAVDHVEPYWSYIFCLLLSLRGANRQEPGPAPTNMFEEVAEAAAGRYVDGQSLKFGFPRTVLPAGFGKALDDVCLKIGEGIGAKSRPSSRKAKDARLDIIAWRPFPDGRSAQLIIFGQCAAGGNWRSKLTDLQPRTFTDLYWKEPPVVEPVKAFFTPFRVKLDQWEETGRYAGLVFDRCRIAHCTFGTQAPESIVRWSKRQLRDITLSK